jgi:hypothetical protein
VNARGLNEQPTLPQHGSRKIASPTINNNSIAQAPLRLVRGCSFARLFALGGGAAFAHGGRGHNGGDHFSNGGIHLGNRGHGRCIDCGSSTDAGGRNIDSVKSRPTAITGAIVITPRRPASGHRATGPARATTPSSIIRRQGPSDRRLLALVRFESPNIFGKVPVN